ncbi:hypothetical protein K437DRAFT_253421 [Tilletiaria anomala UBC 951]|uniref:DNA replication factor Cdt1 C-terminal domain-containing protein n=1 Tax=Tilletiaria anomala (strain ATCC 24038 / CBS 436.72 / UBC 951) TaxID=1037660 RepID=A0A066WR24_TILAU|nr:uncharacterized protein K437DRAFT_253421 [Tilletiaria anomala UBC 951]KDN53095.1 hypothetical protein K437DRAFT_253421 [Tilletiaria anomala UBC 951]
MMTDGSSRNVSARTPKRTLLDDDEDLVVTPRSVRENSLAAASTQKIPITHDSIAQFSAPREAKKVKTHHEPDGSFLSTLEGPYSYVPRTRRNITRTDSSSSNPFHPESKVPLREEVRLKAQNAELPPLKCFPSPQLELPDHYKALEQLHAAIETALVQHFATSSNLGPMETSVSKDGVKNITLPKVLTYSELTQLVRQRRPLGKTQFAQLAWLWSGGKAEMFDPKRSKELEEQVKEVRGLGFVVRKVKAIDAKTRKDAWDLGLGVELSLHRPKREQTPPLQVGYLTAGPRADTPSSPVQSSPSTFTSSPPTTPSKPARIRTHTRPELPSSPAIADSPPSTPSKLSRVRTRARLPSNTDWTPGSGFDSSVNRDQMSISTMWNNGIELRKQEVARRLRERAAQHYEAFVRSQDDSQEDSDATVEEMFIQDHTALPSTPPATPRKPSHTAVVGHGGLLTPSATRSPSHKPGSRRVMKVGDATQLPSLEFWPADFNIEHIPPVPQAALPSLREERSIKVPSLNLKLAQSSSPDAEAKARPTAPVSTAGMTPAERESAMRARIEAKAGLKGPTTSLQMMQEHKDKAILSRLPRVGQVLVGFFPQKTHGPAGRYEKKKAHEVIAVVKQALGRTTEDDAQRAIEMVRKAAPGFLAVETVPGQGAIYARIGRPAMSSQELQTALRKASSGELAM